MITITALRKAIHFVVIETAVISVKNVVWEDEISYVS
jgi:hypothetical protein